MILVSQMETSFLTKSSFQVTPLSKLIRANKPGQCQYFLLNVSRKSPIFCFTRSQQLPGHPRDQLGGGEDRYGLSFTKTAAGEWTKFTKLWVKLFPPKNLILLYRVLVLSTEKAMAPHSSTLAWKIPWMEEPGGLPSMASHRVGHDWNDLAAVAAVLSKLLTW